MKAGSIVVVGYTFLAAASALETQFGPQMHRRLVEVKGKNDASNRNRNLRGKEREDLLTALDEMPVPKPTKIKTTD